MKEQESGPVTENASIHSSLWSELSRALPGTYTVNPPSELPINPHILFTFCPLYASSDLSKSKLLPPSAQISDSRVSGKWTAIQKAIELMANYFRRAESPLKTTVVFANKGVLLGHSASDEDEIAIEGHEERYREAVDVFFKKVDVPYRFLNYDDLGIRCPRFMQPLEPIPYHEEKEDESFLNLPDEVQVIHALNSFSRRHGIPTLLEVNRYIKGKIRQLVKGFGPETAYWLISGYLAFDYQIPRLVGADGIYISTERFEPIFRIASLTPGVREMTRVEIPA